MQLSRATRATRMLKQAGVAFAAVSYDDDPEAERIGVQAAEALGEPPERVLKTLMTLVDGKPVCVIAPSDRQVSMKKLAAAFGGKSAQMMSRPTRSGCRTTRSAGSARSDRREASRPRSRRSRWRTPSSSSTGASADCRCG
jgi:hypothetical protein